MISYQKPSAFSIVSVPCIVLIINFSLAAAPPAPLDPLPSSAQVAWHKNDVMLMTHFSLETYALRHSADCGRCEHGNRCDTSPTLFNPVAFDANQWVATAKAGGFKGIVAMAKHQDGFCTWQTKTTSYSVASSPWRGGKGDIIKDLADACHAAGLRFGVYCSPWDKNYCDSQIVHYPSYTQFFAAQIKELLTDYGTIDEIWFDGNWQEDMKMGNEGWDTIYQAILSCHQPLVTFQGFWVSDTAHIRVWWGGNESGMAPEENWCIHPKPDSTLATIPSCEWWPFESDVSLEGMWFWENLYPIASLDRFKETYLTSAGRGSPAMINIAPNPSGLFDADAVNRVTSFKAWVDSIYSSNIAIGKTATASSVRENDTAAFGPDNAIDTAYDTYWAPDSSDSLPTLEVDLKKTDTIRMFILQEYIPLGQRVARHTIQTWNGSQWNTVRDTTRWCACDGNTGHWWKVDLGGECPITGTQIVWESSTGSVYKYKIEISSDNATWSLFLDRTANTDTSQTQRYSLPPYTEIYTRYIRITITGLDPGSWASFYEFRVLGNNNANIAVYKPTSSDCSQSAHPAYHGNNDLIGENTTIGCKRIYNLPNPVEASKVRLIVNRSRSFPLINNFGIIGNHVTSATKWDGTPVERQKRVTVLAVRPGHIRLLGPAVKNIILELVRVDGKMIKRQHYGNTSGIMDFPVPRLASGVYILKSSIDGKVIGHNTVFIQ
jgi:alpha-L-fucosidase